MKTTQKTIDHIKYHQEPKLIQEDWDGVLEDLMSLKQYEEDNRVEAFLKDYREICEKHSLYLDEHHDTMALTEYKGDASYFEMIKGRGLGYVQD